MEILDIVDENGIPTGETVDRKTAHQTGVRHRTSHVWLLRKRAGQVEVLLQKRSSTKDSNPGCYDISSAGHIPAGEDFLSSALRELQEELGLTVSEKALVYCGTRRFFYRGEFYGQPFLDHQVSNVYALWIDVEPWQLKLQESEVEAVRWMEFEECVRSVARDEFAHCIHVEELEMLRKAAIQYQGDF